MTLLNKFGIGGGNGAPRNDRSENSGTKAPAAVAVAGTGASRAPEQHVATRVSNGLKEFLWNLDGLGRGTLLDLGPAWQTTLNFFIERGFRVTSDDILRGWADFKAAEEAKEKDKIRTPEDYAERTPEARAKRFLAENFQYQVSSFDA